MAGKKINQKEKVSVPNKKYFSLVRKRDGRIVPFDINFIVNAVLKRMTIELEGSEKDALKVASHSVDALLKKYPASYVIGVEQIQDAVEQALILLDYAKSAKGYILYRQERALLREQRRVVPEQVKKLVVESKKYFRNSLSEFVYYRSY